MIEHNYPDPIKEDTITCIIQELQQGSQRLRLYIEEFKLFAADLNWNELSLITQFKHGLNDRTENELIRQGVPPDTGSSLQNLHYS
ncbi:hypothetical protein E2320_001621 [Naja naja]|nr:hypothetical protein E2320_001621 [Naja naja]